MTGPGNHYVYRLYDRDDCLLYVGVTRNLKQRQQSHVATKAWWREVSRWRLTGPFLERSSAENAEREAIYNEYPLYNLRHANVLARRKLSPVALSRRQVPHADAYETAARLTGATVSSIRTAFERGEIASLTRNGLQLWLESLPTSPPRAVPA